MAFKENARDLLIYQRSSTLPADVSTVPEDCSTDCKNLRTFFQFPPQRSRRSFRAFGCKEVKIECAWQMWNAANSTIDRNLPGQIPWLPLNIRHVVSKHARSAAPRWPELNISRIKCAGSSSIENVRLRSAIRSFISL